MPHGQSNFPAAVTVRQFRNAQHLFGRNLPHRHRDTYVIQSALLLRKIADVRMRQFLARPTHLRRVISRATERLAQLLFHLGEIFIQRHFLQQMLQARLLAVRPAPALDIHAHNRRHDFVDFRRRHDHAEVARERLVARRPAQRDAEQHFLPHPHRFHANVVGVFHRSDEPAAVVGDVKLARQIVKRAVIDDDLPERLHQRHHVNQFHRVESGGGIGRQVADIVRSRSARVQPHALDATQHLRRVLGQNEPHLEIRAGGNLQVTRGQFLCNTGKLLELISLHGAAGNPQPRHERILHRRQEEKPVPLEPKYLLLVRRFVADGILHQNVVGIQRM